MDFYLKLTPILKYFKKVGLVKVGLDRVSKDQEVIDRILKDPLMYKSKGLYFYAQIFE